LAWIRAQNRSLDSLPVRFRLARLWSGLRAYDLAFATLRDLLERHPTHDAALRLGGELKVRQKLGVLRFRDDEYLTGFRTALPDSLPDAPSTSAGGEAAVPAAGRLGLESELAALYVDLGVAFYHGGGRDRAVDCFRRALDFQPGHPSAVYNLEALGAAGG
jgi:tetratricopeptide (TPR) repeat protein